jgi:uncharacterized protein (DUF934 family)
VLFSTGCTQQSVSTVSEKPPKQKALEAADQALLLAASSISPQRELHQLQAAQLFANTQQHQKALSTLETIAASELPTNKFAEYSLLYAELALANDRFFVARQLLSNSRMAEIKEQLSTAQQQKWLQLRGELFALLGEDTKSLMALIELSEISSSDQQRQEAHEKIWLVLTHIPHDKMEELAANDAGPNVAVDLSSDVDPTEIAGRLDTIDLIRVTFPSFADGRGFSVARRLRLMGYQGRLRAKGHVLADQCAMARRAGFNEVEIDDELALRQPESHWLRRSDWQAHDYQSRLRG